MARHARPCGPGRRRGRPLAVAGLLTSVAVLVIGGIGLAGALHRSSAAADAGSGPAASGGSAASVPTDSPVPIPAPSGAAAATSSAGQTADPAAAVHPVTLRIPSIGVTTSLELLGVAADGTLQTPADPKQAGWFTGSAVPGDPGPVVIAGHVDSRTGPAVFAHLKKVVVGAPITVTLSGGKQVGYRVTSVVAYAKDKFPTQRVYGAVPDSELRLITCGGAFVDGEYVDNVIVFAALSR